MNSVTKVYYNDERIDKGKRELMYVGRVIKKQRDKMKRCKEKETQSREKGTHVRREGG